MNLLVFTKDKDFAYVVEEKDELNDSESVEIPIGRLKDVFKQEIQNNWIELLKTKNYDWKDITSVKEQLRELRVQSGFEDEKIKDAPSLALVDFSKELKEFENTHTHLTAFDIIEKELGLIGDTYYPLKKFSCYFVESLRQEPISFNVGGKNYDNRIHGVIIGPAGKGKGAIKNAMRKCGESFEIKAQQLNVEQLLGKVIVSKKTEEEIPGLLTYPLLIADECNDLLNEVDRQYSSIAQYFRIASDPYNENFVEKKLVAQRIKTSFCPPTRFLLLTHPIEFTPIYFDSGSFRRNFCFTIEAKQVGIDSLKTKIGFEANNGLKEYFQNESELHNLHKSVKSLEFGLESINEFDEFYLTWSKFVYLHPNQRVRKICRGLDYSAKLYFMRLIAILSISRGSSKVSVETTRTACLDTIHFLLCTIQNYANNSRPTMSRDVWKTNDEKEQTFLEWLHYNGATSKEKSSISISDAQTKISWDIWGVNDRQAREKFSNLKKRGLIDSYKGQHDSKVWLGFVPNDQNTIDFSGETFPDLVSFIREKKNESGEGGGNKNKVESGESGSVHPPLSNNSLYTHNPTILSLSHVIVDKNILEAPPQSASLATLKVLKTRLANTKDGLPRDLIEEAVGVEVLAAAKKNGDVYEPRSGWICLPNQKPPRNEYKGEATNPDIESEVV